jgi:plasmid stabilization system protein ParE
MTDLVFLLSADIDIQQAYEYYENYQEGRGDLFLRHLDAAFTHLRLFPKIAPLFHGTYRRLLVPRYPYGIFYMIESPRIIVVAITHFQQNPSEILRRLEP